MRLVPRLCALHPGICFTTEEKARRDMFRPGEPFIKGYLKITGFIDPLQSAPRRAVLFGVAGWLPLRSTSQITPYRFLHPNALYRIESNVAQTKSQRNILNMRRFRKLAFVMLKVPRRVPLHSLKILK
jgi:hypothetical protein